MPPVDRERSRPRPLPGVQAHRLVGHITLAMVAHAHPAFLAAGPPPDTRHDTGEAEGDLATQGPDQQGRSHPDNADLDKPPATWSRSPSTRSAACTPTSTNPNTRSDTESAGHTDAATKPAAAAATTNAINADRKMRLEY